MASYSWPVQRITTVLGSFHGQASTSGALPLPLERMSCPSLCRIAVDLYSILKYQRLRRGGCASGSVARRARQLLRAEKKAWTQASAVWACSCLEVCQRIICAGESQIPWCLTVRQKETRQAEYSRPHSRANSSSCALLPIFT